MKIIVNKEPFYDDDFDNEEWVCKAEFNSTDDSSATSVVKSLVSAMELEGYSLISIYQALNNNLSDLREDIESIQKFNLDEVAEEF